MLHFIPRPPSRPVHPIDRYNSRPLDMHVWSEHPEARRVTELVYCAIGAQALERPKGKRPKKKLKHQLRVLLLDLYVSWLEDPEQAVALPRDKNRYKINSRYNRLFVSDKVIVLADLLRAHGYIEVQPGYFARVSGGRSYCTRIRPLPKLLELFEGALMGQSSIQHNNLRETVVLRNDKGDNIDYQDTEETCRMRAMLSAYNDLLQRTSIDIPELQGTVLSYVVQHGKEKGRSIHVPLSAKGKFVYRVFSRGSFSLNGRITGGFWQFIPSEHRQKIYIDGVPTVELDYSGLHINILSLRKGVSIQGDPYDLGEVHLPNMGRGLQRDCVKSLVLVALNARRPQTAYAAFRDNHAGTNIARLRDTDLTILLDAFIEKHPHLEDDLCADRGVSLMNIDSGMAEEIIIRFMAQRLPILCVHDSFLVQEAHEALLKTTMEDVSYKFLGETVPLKTKRPSHTDVSGHYRFRLLKHRLLYDD